MVETGITRDEFSRRFIDSALKIGDLDKSSKQTAEKFPDSLGPQIQDVYGHFGNAFASYQESRTHFGEGVDESDYSHLRQRFPMMPSVQSESDSVTDSHRYYPDPPILKALWLSAVEENNAAEEAISSLESKL